MAGKVFFHVTKNSIKQTFFIHGLVSLAWQFDVLYPLEAIVLSIIKFAKHIIKRSSNSQLLENRKQAQDGNSVCLVIMHRGFQSIAQ